MRTSNRARVLAGVASVVSLLVAPVAASEGATSALPGRGCTVVTVARDGRVIFAGNDDSVDRDTVVWVDPPRAGRHGAMWIGAPDNVQQGVNQRGLAYDANGLPPVVSNPHHERRDVPGGYASYPIEIERADADHARLAQVARGLDAMAIAWVTLAAAFGALATFAWPGADGRRSPWGLAGLVLGPVVLAAWFASRPPATDTGGDGRWRRAIIEAVRWMPWCVAGTVVAIAATLGIPAVTRVPALQFAAFYGLPLVLGWVAWSGSPSRRLQRGVVCGHLALAGIWVAVMAVLRRVVWASGLGVTPVVLGWGAAAVGAGIGIGLVTTYLASTPHEGWRRGWWWAPLSLAALVLGAAIGATLARLIEAWPLIAIVLGGRA